MNQILLTVLLSVLGTLLVGYFIWSIVRLREVITETKANRKDVNYLNDSLGKVESQIQNDIRRHNEDVTLHLESKIQELNEYILNTQTNLDKFDELINRDIDRRFDKLYQKIYSECPSMKGE
jgi:Mg2+ and Co2+ transporter CorA